MNDIFKLALIPDDVQVTFYTVGGVEVKGYVDLIDEATGMVAITFGRNIIRLSGEHVTHWFTVEPR